MTLLEFPHPGTSAQQSEFSGFEGERMASSRRARLGMAGNPSALNAVLK